MKNIHILPTDKPSRLHLWTDERGTRLELCELEYSHTRNTQHIYITSDEEIKEGDWIGYPNLKNWIPVQYLHGDLIGSEKKIILTTDQELINYGVQAIDDTFLEWLVKNPTCEFVEVDYDVIVTQTKALLQNQDNKTIAIPHRIHYKIIIPQEEPKPIHQQIIDIVGGEDRFREIAGIKPKQETLEEAAVRIAYDSTEDNKGFPQMKAFINGAKWMEERMYSEEEVRLMLSESFKASQEGYDITSDSIIKRFKKKS
jgi:hypothetical protein